ncbi:MAG TPA: TIGR03619 family F420-dependent LLM class oxidoreductase [Candidatus Dormibacteraeota bacterium]|nr:TIGR03619 family F420-dependent LLM class oxidoreductase [Candidatus Dormibacteraeota bacterium]
MDYGLALPHLGDDANLDGVATAIDLAEQHGFTDVWVTDHILVDHDAAEDYGRIYEAVTTLAWAAARTSRIRLGTSVIVVPMRNAVLLAKQLATLDALSNGRLIAGFGVGWSPDEFANVGAIDRFHERGAYTDETIALCRHLWSGSTEPFHGRYHQFDDFVFGPLPVQGGNVPIWIGARDERALRRVGRLADGYHASSASPAALAGRIPVIRAAAEAAGRPMPRLSARVRLELGVGAQDFYTMHGSPAEVAAEIRAYADLGVDHLALMFPPRDAAGLTFAVERFLAEVKPLA